MAVNIGLKRLALARAVFLGRDKRLVLNLRVLEKFWQQNLTSGMLA